MSHYAATDASSPIVRRAALQAIAGLPERDCRKEAEAVWQWIRSHVRLIEDRAFVAGLEGVDADDAEVLVRPVDILTMPQPAGDCDDHSMLAASMLRALGIPAQFRTIAAGADPATYSHVFVLAELPDGELALDASHGPRPGWQAQPTGKTRRWRIDEMSKGLGAIDWGGIVQTSVTTVSDIMKARYGQAPAGVYQQTPEGLYYRQPEGAAPYTFPGGGFGLTEISAGTLGLIVVAVIGLTLIMRRGSK